MLSVDAALTEVLSRILPLGAENGFLLDALGRVAAEDVSADRALPGFDNSGMDGYAVVHTDTLPATRQSPVRLRVLEDVAAGTLPTRRVRRGEASRIMTGAPIPEGADGVVPLEETESEAASVIIFSRVESGAYIRRAAEDVRKGDIVISRGDLLRAPEIGMLASLGRSCVSIYQRPVVAILCTGDELVDLDEELDKGKVYSSNSYHLAAQVIDSGGIPLQLGIAGDRKEEIEEKMRQGLRADVLISSAGVSVGDYDLVKDVLKELGMQTVFWKVAMKPGKPLVFGLIEGKPVFGLPGNPVSSMVAFEQFVRPSLLKMMGHRRLFRPVIDAILRQDISKEPGRRHFVRVRISLEEGEYFVVPTGAQGSNLLTPIMKANGLMIIPEDQEVVRAGEKVKVQLLDRNF